jgi:hypothetical protein
LGCGALQVWAMAFEPARAITAARSMSFCFIDFFSDELACPAEQVVA